MFLRHIFLFLLLTFFNLLSGVKLPDIDEDIVKEKITEIMESHVKYQEMTPTILKRTIANYIDRLDPSKTYLTTTDIDIWINPTDPLIDNMMKNYQDNDFSEFEKMNDKMIEAIERHHSIEASLSNEQTETPISTTKDFYKQDWPKDENELIDRIQTLKRLQLQTANALDKEKRDKILERLEKSKNSYENDISNKDLEKRKKFIFTNILKALSSSLDAHTAYFTPGEATQFMIDVQHRLFGIGVQLKDSLNGFTIVQLIKGGPADKSQQIKPLDRIIAIDDEPVIGMEIYDVVELIRGEQGSETVLTIARENTDTAQDEEILEVTLIRDEVVVEELRLETSTEPFGDGVIGCLKLHSFYQDPHSSSSEDMTKAIEKLRRENNVKALILDLRYNSGGMLSQAISVTGLFITQGVVVSVKDNQNSVQHLRDFTGYTAWDGPLIVLTSHASASASEIVAQALQDYGRAIIVGDNNTFGKGSFQTFTLDTVDNQKVNPEGEYKVTRGIYYTASGKSPQLIGVKADIVVPGILSKAEIGEGYYKFPLENDSIESNIPDKLTDLTPAQKRKLLRFYGKNLQPKLTKYTDFLEILSENSRNRIEHSPNYQNFIKAFSSKNEDIDDNKVNFGEDDLQFLETINIAKDLVLLTD